MRVGSDKYSAFLNAEIDDFQWTREDWHAFALELLREELHYQFEHGRTSRLQVEDERAVQNERDNVPREDCVAVTLSTRGRWAYAAMDELCLWAQSKGRCVLARVFMPRGAGREQNAVHVVLLASEGAYLPGDDVDIVRKQALEASKRTIWALPYNPRDEVDRDDEFLRQEPRETVSRCSP